MAGDAFVLPVDGDLESRRIDRRHAGAEAHFHAQTLELLARLLAQTLGHCLKNARAALDQQDFGAGRIDPAKLAFQRVMGDFCQRAGHFDAGRAAADHDEGQKCTLAHRIGLFFGLLEGHQHMAADLERIGQRLQSRRELGPLVVAEVAVRRTRRHDQVVVAEAKTVRKHGFLRCGKNLDDFTEKRGDVALFAEEKPGRRRNGRCGESRGRHLVEQRLKEMVVGFLDDRDVDVGISQMPGSFQAAEAAADDQYPRTGYR